MGPPPPAGQVLTAIQPIAQTNVPGLTRVELVSVIRASWMLVGKPGWQEAPPGVKQSW